MNANIISTWRAFTCHLTFPPFHTSTETVATTYFSGLPTTLNLGIADCSVCRYPMNGMFYACGECGFKADIKCVCMPDTIYHAAHPQHLLNHVLTKSSLRKDVHPGRRLPCAADCGNDAFSCDCYKCSNSSCDFIVHIGCVLLPASVTSARWDEHHLLPLTYNATLKSQPSW